MSTMNVDVFTVIDWAELASWMKNGKKNVQSQD